MGIRKTGHASHDRSPVCAALVSIVLAFPLSGCGTSSAINGGGISSPSSSTCTVRVTPDCSAYTYSNPSPGTEVVTARKSSAGDNREFFWDRAGRSESDQTVCASFATGQGTDQQGVVLRLRRSPNGKIEAITVTRNIWLGVFNVFNFHVWNTGADPSSPFAQFGSVVISELPIRPAIYPLNMCARTVSATDIVQFVVWTRGQEQPVWGGAAGSGEARIPDDAPSTGRCGWFVGHLIPGTSMTYRRLSIDGAIAQGLP